MLNGWDQNFVGSNQIHRNDDGEKMIMILIEPGAADDTVTFLFEDTRGYYREINENPAYATLRNHFYDHLGDSLKEDFGISRENVSMIMCPRNVYMFGDLDPSTLHTKAASERIIPQICEVSFVNSSSVAGVPSAAMAVDSFAAASADTKKRGRDEISHLPEEKAESTRSMRSRKGGKRRMTRRKMMSKRRTMRRKRKTTRRR